MATKINDTMNRAEIDKAIASVTRRAATLQEDIHRTAVSILLIWSNGTAPAKIEPSAASETAKWALDALARLSTASPYHGKAFATWMAAFLPVRYDDGEWMLDSNKLSPKVFKAAKAEPFYEFAPAPKAKPMDLTAQVHALIDKARKRADKPVDGDNIDSDLLNKLMAAVAKAEDDIPH